ncbi:uncharacterized protein LOC133187962 [Saccostrea echinata]|uniref:uncharacterized protein LOC133187962 n=1 Tax=Saccostrea echinata TaxID=191078 RepID=UPI002A814A79|nr:uncharacterized protein LOC133187962 [Saccostrea echinata]
MKGSKNLRKILICVVVLYVLIVCLKKWKSESSVQFEKEKAIEKAYPSPKTIEIPKKSTKSNLAKDMIKRTTQTEGSKLHQSATLEACKHFRNKSFSPSMEENMNVVKNYKFTVPNEYLQRLQLDQHGIDTLINQKQNCSIPVIVSGVSENHFTEIIGLLNSINIHVRKKYPDLKLIVFNLGLSNAHINDLRKMCSCDVRQFPFEKFPPHVKRLQGYTWKPIILQIILQEYDFVMWVDSSIRLNEKLNELFDRAKRTGIQILEGDGSIAVRTHRKLFDFLKEEPCMFNYPEVQPGWILMKRTEFTLKVLLRPILSCALQFGCMDFPNAAQFLYCKDPTKLSACHRYDQSVHGIILTRLFNKNRKSISFKEKEFGIVCRGCLEKFKQIKT